MTNLFISDLDKKDVNHFTTDFGLKVRKSIDKPFKKLCNIFTNANIISLNSQVGISDEDYFRNLDITRIPLSNYNIKKKFDILN